MPYNQNTIIPAVNQTLAGVAELTLETVETVNEAAANLLAFHAWLKALNRVPRQDMNFQGNGLETLKAALRFITLIQLNAESAARDADNNPWRLFVGDVIPANLVAAKLQLNNATVSANNQNIADVFAAETLAQYANDLIDGINTYLDNNDLTAITTDKVEQDKIKFQLHILNNHGQADPNYIKQHGLPEMPPADRKAINDQTVKLASPFNRLLNFTFFGFVLAAGFPWAFLYPAFIGLTHSIANAYVLPEPTSRRAYGTRVLEMFPGEGTGWSLLRGLLNIPGVVIDTLTAIPFETIRILFSYDDWSPISQRNFDRAEKFLFNALFSPVLLVAGAARGLYEAAQNIWKTVTQGVDPVLGDLNNTPYGLAGVRGVRWLGRGLRWVMNTDEGDSPFVTGSKWLLRLALWPMTVLYLGLKLTLGATAVQALDNFLLRAGDTIGIILSVAFLPIDAFVGAFVYALRFFGVDINKEREKGFYTWAASAWAGFWFSTVIGPAVLMPMISSFFAGFGWVAQLIPHWFGAPYHSAGEIFRAIYSPIGENMWNAFWGHTSAQGVVHPGIFEQGAHAFSEGMKSFGSAITSENAWRSFGNLFVEPSAAFKVFTEQAWKAVILAGGAFGLARGWSQPKSVADREKNGFFGGIATMARGFVSLIGLGSVFKVDEPAVAAVAPAVVDNPNIAANIAANVKVLNNMNPAPRAPVRAPVAPVVNNNPPPAAVEQQQGSTAPGNPLLPSGGPRSTNPPSTASKPSSATKPVSGPSQGPSIFGGSTNKS